MICLDQMGPESAKRFPGQQVVRVTASGPLDSRWPAERATQEIDDDRRGQGYICGALRPATGEAFTRPFARRTTANWVDFLEQVDSGLPQAIPQVFAIVDNLNVHRAIAVLCFSLAHPRWAFVFQPKYAAYLNLIAPGWKMLRSLALKGRRFETWQAIAQAVDAATPYWNQHRHPFTWGRRRRPRPRRSPGIALVPTIALGLAG